MIAFTIPGRPFAKQRPRFSRKHGRAFTPAETVSYERTVGTIASQYVKAPLTGAVAVEIVAVFAPAASWSQKRRTSALGKPHTQRPDVDNCQKAILDGLNRIAWADDSQIAQITCRKVWGEPEQTTVFIKALDEAEDAVRLPVKGVVR